MTELIKRFNVFTAINELARDARASEKGMDLIPFFYYFVLYQAISHFFSGDLFRVSAVNFTVSFPLRWVHFVSFQTAILSIEILFLLTAFAAALGYRYRFFRVISLIGIIEYHAFLGAFGSRDHGWILFTAIAFLLILLPDLWRKPTNVDLRKKFLVVIWGITAFIFLIYALAGTGKLLGALGQINAGEPNAFSIDASALHIAEWSFHADSIGMMGAYIINHPLLGWLGFVGIMLLQLGSWAAMFFPRVYRVWGVLLILLHIAIYLSMGVIFIESVILISIFLFESPLAMRPSLSGL